MTGGAVSTDVAVLKSQQALVGGACYSINNYLQLIGQYT